MKLNEFKFSGKWIIGKWNYKNERTDSIHILPFLKLDISRKGGTTTWICYTGNSLTNNPYKEEIKHQSGELKLFSIMISFGWLFGIASIFIEYKKLSEKELGFWMKRDVTKLVAKARRTKKYYAPEHV